MHSCHICGLDFSRRDILSRHLKRKYPCDAQNVQSRKVDQNNNEPSSINELNHTKRSECMSAKEIPTFDGAEFSGEKPVSRETLYKMMEMLNVPEERREEIAREEEKYYEKKMTDKSSSEALSKLELEETMEDFQQYYSELIKERKRDNVPAMIDILNIWKEAGEINEQVYKEVLRKIKSV